MKRRAQFVPVLFLFICAQAGAVTENKLATANKPAIAGKPAFNLELRPSTYVPQKGRDPFGSGTAKPADTSVAGATRTTGPETLTTGLEMLKLQGIMYHSVHPSAMVNNQLMELNKTVTMQTDQGEVTVKTLEITRKSVLLETGGQKIELRTDGSKRVIQ